MSEINITLIMLLISSNNPLIAVETTGQTFIPEIGYVKCQDPVVKRQATASLIKNTSLLVASQKCQVDNFEIDIIVTATEEYKKNPAYKKNASWSDTKWPYLDAIQLRSVSSELTGPDKKPKRVNTSPIVIESLLEAIRRFKSKEDSAFFHC